MTLESEVTTSEGRREDSDLTEIMSTSKSQKNFLDNLKLFGRMLTPYTGDKRILAHFRNLNNDLREDNTPNAYESVILKYVGWSVAIAGIYNLFS